MDGSCCFDGGGIVYLLVWMSCIYDGQWILSSALAREALGLIGMLLFGRYNMYVSACIALSGYQKTFGAHIILPIHLKDLFMNTLGF